VVSRLGRLDILVNNAGILHLESLENTTVEDYIRVFQVNELGVFLGVRTAIRAMKGHGGGSIVNISSVDAVFPSPNTGAYSASKYAIEGITRVAALELRPDNIRVNAVAAGYGSASMLRDATGTVKASRSEDGPDHFERRRLGAKAVMFLASDDSAFVTGAVIPVDNGKTAGESLTDYARRKANVS
jgi:3alpha(or 20beta)-hydroxysteroid dehydrogenase